MSKQFPLFIERLGEYGVPDTHFITNGLLLTEEVIRSAIVSGIDAITISNDAATAATYRRIRGKTRKGIEVRCGGFEDIIAKLKLLRNMKAEYRTQRPAVRIQFTLFDYNKDEVLPFIDTYHLYFQEFYLTHLT